MTPRFSYTCPPGSIIIVTTLPILDTRRNFGPTHPPIDWRLPLPGEGARTVTTIIGVGQPSPPEVTPPGTGDGGLKRPYALNHRSSSAYRPGSSSLNGPSRHSIAARRPCSRLILPKSPAPGRTRPLSVCQPGLA